MGLDLGLGSGGGGGGFSAEYGVAWNQTTDAYTRLGYAPFVATALGVKPADYLFPFGGRRCLVADDHTVNYYCDPNDTTVNITDGGAAVLDGTDGQVMVEITPKYFKYSWAAPVRSWWISNVALPGYTLHPAFSSASGKVYVGAYEGYITGGKLCSISGVLPTVSQTIAQFRAAAVARGTGWHQESFWVDDLIQRMIVIQYADMDSQAVVGRGIDQYTIWPGGPQALTGNSNSIGNANGNNTAAVPAWAAGAVKTLGQLGTPTVANNYTYQVVQAGTTGGTQPTFGTVLGGDTSDGGVIWRCVRIGQYVNLFGVENFWGHIWKFVDGFNVHNSTANRSRAYVCAAPANFSSDTATNYDLVGLLAETDGYARSLSSTTQGLFLPGDVSGGSSATGLADYYYTYFNDLNDSGWRVVRRGGNANNGLYAGAFDWNSDSASSLSGSYFGGRLCLRT